MSSRRQKHISVHFIKFRMINIAQVGFDLILYAEFAARDIA